MQTELAATILLPTHNHGETIRYAVASVLAQTVQNIELFIVGDGVSGAFRGLLQELEASDSRIRFFDNAKHSRRGEPYRHEALQEARGEVVCYITDRDLWLPDHVARLREMLQGADFAHSLSLHVLPGDTYRFHPVDLSLPEDRQAMIMEVNSVAFSCAAHTLKMYRSLPQGWTTTPGKVFTDWYMFRRFLEQPACRAVSGTYPSAVTFPSPPRLAANWTIEDRVNELQRWADRLATGEGRAAYVVDVLQQCITWQNRSAGQSKVLLQSLTGSRLTRIQESAVAPLLKRRARKLFDLQRDHGKMRMDERSVRLAEVAQGQLKFSVMRNNPGMVLPPLDSTGSEYCLFALSVECPYETNMRLLFREHERDEYHPALSVTVRLAAGDNTVYFWLHRSALRHGLFYEMASVFDGVIAINYLKIHTLK